MFRFLSCLAALCLAAASAGAQQSSRLDEIVGRGTLRVGMTGDYLPFTYLDKETQKFRGFDVDMKYFSKTFVAATIAFALASPLAAPPATASTSFDGTWSVRIASSSSECGNGQTVSIGISNGQVTSSMVSASGRVADAGNISVILASGIKKATGFGHLSGSSGSGTWRGMLCSGRWTAEKL